MPSMLALTLLVAVLIWFVLGVVRSFIRVWLDHRARLAALESGGDVPPSAAARNENYVTTGALLAALGFGAIGAGWYSGHGSTAVGVYVGGVISLVMGVLVGLLGVVIRGLGTPAEAPDSLGE